MMMSTLVLPLASSEAALARVGGKGANLAALTRAGFLVPPGFLITTDAYRAFVAANQIGDRILALARSVTPDDPVALEQISEAIRALFTDGHMPEEIAHAIVMGYQELSHGAAPARLPVAVRSSATAEDLPGLSFAGQQDTYLNVVGSDAVIDAVKRCWASLWTARAIGYRARNHIPPDEVALAVVVQALIASEVSGVLFTANPLTGRRDEIVIDASFGLGEAIVSGQVEPDHYVVVPQTWQITGRKLGAKALTIVPRADGGTEHIMGGDGHQALPDEQIVELARVARRVAEHFGSPQDIEWAWAGGQLYLLQSRPITSLYPLPDMPARPGETRVYWCLNSVQGVVEPFTPMGRDVLRLVAGGMTSMLHVQRPIEQVVLSAGGRLFVDITDATQVLLAVLSKADPAAQQTLQRLIDAGRVALKRPFTRSRIRMMLPTFLPLIGRALAAAQAPEYIRARAITDAERFLEQVRQHSAAAKTLAQRLAALEADISQAVRGIVAPVFPVIVPGMGSLFLIQRWLGEWLDLKPEAALQLLRGLAGNVTTEMDLYLWSRVQTIRAHAGARSALLTWPVEDLVTAYRRGALPATAQRAIEQFFDRYGMRGMGEIDFGRARWRDDPRPIVQTIQNYLQLEDPELAPDAMFVRGAAEAERRASELIAQVRGTRLGAIRARLLGGAIRRMRLLVGVRESPKFYIIQLFGIYHAALLDSGRELAARGALAQAEDIFFVPLAQLRRFANGEALDLKPIVAAQRAEYDQDCARRRMPRLLLSTGEVFYEGLSEAGAADLVGDPVSPGVVEGRARVVLDPRGVRLDPGEILVCPATDPGWTPLFLTAGGLVMEIGGMITHGSVVAREYGIPAVVGVHEATTRIANGQRIRVDGTQGRIVLLEPAPSAEELVAAQELA
jgi:rifampicin phosphotransferase